MRSSEKIRDWNDAFVIWIMANNRIQEGLAKFLFCEITSCVEKPDWFRLADNIPDEQLK